MGHDQLFKAILRHFFGEFLELFFPQVAERLDFTATEFPEAELFKGFPDGASRQPDVVARVRTRDGEPELVVVHVEVQARTETDFGRRMFEYYSLLWLRFEAPVFPVVLYVKEGRHEPAGTEMFVQELFGYEVVKFRYASITLARMAAEEYVEKVPLGTALAALMGWRSDTDELERRLRLLQRLVASGLDKHRYSCSSMWSRRTFPCRKIVDEDTSRGRSIARCRT